MFNNFTKIYNIFRLLYQLFNSICLANPIRKKILSLTILVTKLLFQSLNFIEISVRKVNKKCSNINYITKEEKPIGKLN